jgi:hypothetical protein
MESIKSYTAMKITAAAALAAVISVNALAVYFRLGGISPADIADLYPNLLAPADFSFAIWGLIYLLLAIYAVWQLASKNAPRALTYKVDILLSVSAAAIILWIFSWHLRLVPLSMLFMAVILVSLSLIARLVAAQDLTMREKLFLKLPFAVFFGWITVAAIANAAVLLVSLGVDGMTLTSESLTIITLTCGTILAMWTGIHFRSAAYLLAVIWAYAGVLARHTSPGGFGMRFPEVVDAINACLVLLVGALAVELISAVAERTKKLRETKTGGL